MKTVLRSALVASPVLGLGAFDHKHKEIEVEKAKIEAEIKANTEELKKSGAYDVLSTSSQKAEERKFLKEVTDMKKVAVNQAKKSMTHEKALEVLGTYEKTQMSEDDKAAVATLLEKHGKKSSALQKVAVTEDEKEMYVKAMKALNDMFLSVDDARINTLTTCTVDLNTMNKNLFFYWDAIRDLENSMMTAYTKAIAAIYQMFTEDMHVHEEMDNMEKLLGVQKVALGEQEVILEGHQADVDLYKFILKQILKKCPASKEPSTYLQIADHSNKTEVEKQAVAFATSTNKKETCIAKLGVNKAILQIFADPDVLSAAEKDLSWHGHHSLKTTLKHIRESEEEEIHPKYQPKTAFLQVAKRSEPIQSEGGVCGSADGLDCPTLMTIVGQELECHKQLVREQEAVIKKIIEEQKEEREDVDKQKTQYESQRDNAWNTAMGYYQEGRGYISPRHSNMITMHHYFDQSRERRWECYLQLFELENNYFCAVKHLREYMKGLTVAALSIDEEDISDCSASDFMSPVGQCLVNGKDTPCIDDDRLPTEENNFPQQTYARMSITPFHQGDATYKKIGNHTIALNCPSTMQMQQTCNLFLCPEDCELSDWSEWSACTAQCDMGSQTKSRRVLKPARSGGQSCGDTQGKQDCNSHACDVNCLLHDDWSATDDCLTACTPQNIEGVLRPANDGSLAMSLSHPHSQRLQLLKKHIKEDAKGKGDCPAKHAWDERVILDTCQERICSGDELCAEPLDLVIAYECSSTVTRLGCWFMASFVVNLLEKLPSSVYGSPAVNIALVKFGNGYSRTVDGGQSFFVNPAHQITNGLTADVGSLPGQLYSDVIKMFMPNPHYTLGFNNIGQALKLSEQILDASTRTNSDSVQQKVLVLTKGKRSDCTIVKSIAEGLKSKKVGVDFVVINSGYAGNDKPFQVLHESATFPHFAHFHVIEGMAKLNDYFFQKNAVSAILPGLCPGAMSVKAITKKECEDKYQILHRGRTCKDWETALSENPVDLKTCRDIAAREGYQGFIHAPASSNEDSSNADEGSTSANCFTHEKDGKKAQTNKDGKPFENTCNYVPDYGKGNKEEYLGWAKQPEAVGTHYKVMEGREINTMCTGAWNSPLQPRTFAQFTEDITKYFIGAKK